MGRALPAFAFALIVALSAGPVLAQSTGKRRAYKPDKQAAAEATEPEQASAKDGENAKPASGYEAELEAAKTKRDKALEDAAANETDRRALEKKKTEIFAQYAAIVAELRDKYLEQHPEEAAKGQAASKRPKATKRQPPPKEPAPTPRKDRGKKPKTDDAGSLAEAEQQLADEATRHAAKLETLNAQLKDAEASGNKRQIRAAQKAIEKENNSYDTRRSLLERRVRDAGGPSTPAPKG